MALATNIQNTLYSVHMVTLIHLSHTPYSYIPTRKIPPALASDTHISDDYGIHLLGLHVLFSLVIGWLHGAPYLSENAGIVGGPGAVPQQLTVTQGAERFESLRLSLP